MSAEALVCALIKTDLRAEHISCLSILLSLILLLAIVCKGAQSIGPIITQSMGKLLQNAYFTITSSNNSAFKWISCKKQKVRHPPGLSYRSHTRPILYDVVRWWSDNMKLWGHPTIRYLWTCHHSARLITCTLVNLSSVICCHYLMTMALACIQATQRHQAIVRLNQGGGGDLQYRKAEYSMASEHEAQKKRQDVQRAKCVETTKGKKSGKCKLLLPGQHCILGTLIWQENGEIKKTREKKNAETENKTTFKAVIL